MFHSIYFFFHFFSFISSVFFSFIFLFLSRYPVALEIREIYSRRITWNVFDLDLWYIQSMNSSRELARHHCRHFNDQPIKVATNFSQFIFIVFLRCFYSMLSVSRCVLLVSLSLSISISSVCSLALAYSGVDVYTHLDWICAFQSIGSLVLSSCSLNMSKFIRTQKQNRIIVVLSVSPTWSIPAFRVTVHSLRTDTNRNCIC